MTIFQGGLGSLSRLLGVSEEHAEAALHSERAAKVTLSRRNLLLTGSALALGTLFSFPEMRVVPRVCWVEPSAPLGGDGSRERPFNRMEQAEGAEHVYLFDGNYSGQTYTKSARHHLAFKKWPSLFLEVDALKSMGLIG